MLNPRAVWKVMPVHDYRPEVNCSNKVGIATLKSEVSRRE